jgi:hypothetical protein
MGGSSSGGGSAKVSTGGESDEGQVASSTRRCVSSLIVAVEPDFAFIPLLFCAFPIFTSKGTIVYFRKCLTADVELAYSHVRTCGHPDKSAIFLNEV